MYNILNFVLLQEQVLVYKNYKQKKIELGFVMQKSNMSWNKVKTIYCQS